MKIYHSFPPISEEDLVAFEKLVDAELPEVYRTFLEKYNGGYVTPFYFRYIGPYSQESLGGVNYFFGIADENERFSLQRNLKLAKGNLPERILPISNNGGGDLICISVSGLDIGKIYFWLHEWSPENEENLFLIADDFDSFLKSLFEYEEDDK